MRDGEPPAFPKRPRRDAERRRRLAALVLALDDQLENAAHQILGEAALDEPARPEMLLDVAAQHLVQLVVRRQGVLIGLVLAELRRRVASRRARGGAAAPPTPG